MAYTSLHAPLHTTPSAISGIKVIDNRMPVAAWAAIAVGCMLVLMLVYVGVWVRWQNYEGTRHRRLEDGTEMGISGDEELYCASAVRG